MPAPTRPRTPSGNRTARNSVHTWLFLAGFYLLAFALGFRVVLDLQPEPVGDLVLQLVLLAMACWWTIADARRRGRPIPLLTKSWLFLFAWLAVPGYVLWSRRWQGPLWLLLHGVLWLAVAAGTAVVVSIAVPGQRGLGGGRGR